MRTIEQVIRMAPARPFHVRHVGIGYGVMRAFETREAAEAYLAVQVARWNQLFNSPAPFEITEVAA